MRYERQRGFSLTELLVAVAVGAMVMMGIYSVFMNSMTVFQGQQEISQIQFNSKAVVGFMREKVANAGSGVPADVPIPAIDFQNTASNISPRYLLGTDAFQYRIFGNVGQPMRVADYNNPSANARLEQPNYVDPNPVNGDNTSVGNLLLVYHEDIDNYALVEISSVTEVSSGGGGAGNETKVNFSPGLSIYNTPDGLGEDYTGGFAIMVDQNSMETFTLFVDANRVLRMVQGFYDISDPSNALNEAALPLMDNVEDFQVELGFDTDADNIVNSWVFDDTGFDLDDLLAVKVYLLVRSPRENRFTSDVQRPDIDQTDGIAYPDAPDNVRRRLYSFSVQLRNRML